MMAQRRPACTPRHVGYVVKRYPRFSETFIVNEILAHEAADLDVSIFSLRPPSDTHFQNSLSHVRAPVTYLDHGSVRGRTLWAALRRARDLPGVTGDPLTLLLDADDADEVHQAILLAEAVQARGIHHLHAHFATTATSVASMAAGLAGVDFTFTAHAKDIFHESVDVVRLGSLMAKARAVVTVSDFNVQYLRERFGGGAQRVQRVYNGLDLSRFPFVPSRSPGRRVLAVGRLVEKKGFEGLVEACGMLRDRGEPVHCRIVGTGDREPALRSRILSLGLQEQVELVGSLPQAAVVRELAHANLFVAPCITGTDGNQDGLPTVLLEAMAVGTPCVSTPVTGIPELVEHGVTGLLAAEGDPEDLARAMARLLGDPTRAEHQARAGRRRIEECFEVHRNAARMRACFGGSGEVASDAA